ncbi:MAG TPA: aspartate carbamoyltransferase [Euryarchaeota archaeon]|mgnify:CR=1 FL=1|nr:aspartate carbamoyltransferase [Euryarchaeota archaeon]
MDFKGRDVVSIRDFSKEEINHILKTAETMVRIAEGKGKSKLLEGKILANLFFEPSTRTRLSFESAMHRLGGKVLGFSSSAGTSLSKGEMLSDTIRMASSYSDIVVVRNPFEGSARFCTRFSDRPVINAGDGAGQHPTQTLLDLFTIKSEFKEIDGLSVALMGDLKYGRTVHSLAYALALFGAKLHFVAPPELQMPNEILSDCKNLGVEPVLHNSVNDVIPEVDVLYVTRIQKERIPDEKEYQKVANSYRITTDLLKSAKENMRVMHPLPRISEIEPSVDSTPHALYFKQAFNGLPVRMALLTLVLGVE